MTPTTAGLKIEGLHQILIIQNIAHELPSEQTILEFACKGLQDLPGVFKVGLIQGQRDETETSNENGLSQHVFSVKARGHEYSKIIACLEDPAKFLPYLPYVQNLCFYLATLIERQRLQKEKDKYRADLEQKVQERTKELESYRENLQALVNEQKQKLEETQLELVQNERLATLGQLTATVSHELRNPLGTIKSALFTIDDCIELNELQRASRPLELAERNINRCVNIIEELNAYAREKKLEISETNMNDWLKSIVDEIPIPDSIQIEYDFSCERMVCFDQEKLRQVIINLINNAVHALQDKNSTRKMLLITCRVYDERYEISVSDNGIGISDEVKEKMFEPLFSTKSFGLGLGMVIVKKIVEQHRGNIFIESQVGEGSTVTIRLPITLNG